MKTIFLKSAFVAAALLSALGSASAETLRARIPFGFSVDGAAMPAGSYVIRPMANAPSILLFENEETKVQTLVFARAVSGMTAKLATPLTFASSASERMELANIATAEWTYELSTHSTPRVLKGVALTLTAGGK